MPFDIFPSAYVDTAIAVVSKQISKPTHSVRTYVFGKRGKFLQIELYDAQYRQIKQQNWQVSKDHKFVLDPETVSLLHRLQVACPRSLGDVVLMKRGLLFDKSLLRDTRESDQSYLYFEGNVYRYEINVVVNRWIEFGDKIKERPKEFHGFEGERILLR
ncbi:MAG: hypothetical protein ACREOW_01415 [Thermodesulfobacteriota bacterium]